MNRKAAPDFGLRLAHVLADRNPHAPVLFEYSKFAGPPRAAFADELALLQLKYKVLRIAVDERVPVHSRVEGHRWYLTKDRLGIVYLLLVAHHFEEKHVFRLQARMQQIVARSHDDVSIGSEAALEETRQRLFEVAEQFNNALATNAQADCLLSFQESNVQVVERDAGKLELNLSTVRSFEDSQEFSAQLQKRDHRVLLLQAAVLSALALTAVLQLLEFALPAK